MSFRIHFRCFISRNPGTGSVSVCDVRSCQHEFEQFWLQMNHNIHDRVTFTLHISHHGYIEGSDQWFVLDLELIFSAKFEYIKFHFETQILTLSDPSNAIFKASAGNKGNIRTRSGAVFDAWFRENPGTGSVSVGDDKSWQHEFEQFRYESAS